MKKYISFMFAAMLFLMIGCQTKQAPNQRFSETAVVTSTPGKTVDGNNSSENDNRGDEETIKIYARSWMAQDSECWYTADDIGSYSGIYAISKSDESRRLIYQADKETYIISNMALDITGDSIYFLILEREDKIEDDMNIPFEVCTIKKDGTDFSVLLTKESLPIFEKQVVRDLAVQDNYLLLKTDSRTLVWYNIQSGETKTVGDIVTMFGFRKDKIYYISNWSLCVTDIDIQETKVLIQATNEWENHKRKSKDLVSRVMFIGDDIFYCQRAPYGIYQYLDGERKLIYDELEMNGEMYVFTHDGKLYYMRETDDMLIQYDPKTESRKEILTLSNYEYVNKIIDGYLYYSDLNGNIQRVEIYLN